MHMSCQRKKFLSKQTPGFLDLGIERPCGRAERQCLGSAQHRGAPWPPPGQQSTTKGTDDGAIRATGARLLISRSPRERKGGIHDQDWEFASRRRHCHLWPSRLGSDPSGCPPDNDANQQFVVQRDFVCLVLRQHRANGLRLPYRSSPWGNRGMQGEVDTAVVSGSTASEKTDRMVGRAQSLSGIRVKSDRILNGRALVGTSYAWFRRPRIAPRRPSLHQCTWSPPRTSRRDACPRSARGR